MRAIERVNAEASETELSITGDNSGNAPPDSFVSNREVDDFSLADDEEDSELERQMASEMYNSLKTVLPLVASITVCPGFNAPLFSASSIILMAKRSLTEAVLLLMCISK